VSETEQNSGSEIIDVIARKIPGKPGQVVTVQYYYFFVSEAETLIISKNSLTQQILMELYYIPDF
jgi:hypothetical protein